MTGVQLFGVAFLVLNLLLGLWAAISLSREFLVAVRGEESCLTSRLLVADLRTEAMPGLPAARE